MHVQVIVQCNELSWYKYVQNCSKEELILNLLLDWYAADTWFHGSVHCIKDLKHAQKQHDNQ